MTRGPCPSRTRAKPGNRIRVGRIKRGPRCRKLSAILRPIRGDRSPRPANGSIESGRRSIITARGTIDKTRQEHVPRRRSVKRAARLSRKMKRLKSFSRDFIIQKLRAASPFHPRYPACNAVRCQLGSILPGLRRFS